MPVYHFEIVDGVRLDDPVGLDCQTEQDAKAKADLIAATSRLFSPSWCTSRAAL
jgi:hypothetical protein